VAPAPGPEVLCRARGAGIRASMSSTVESPPCPRCGAPVPTTATTGEPGDQLALTSTACPSCGAELERDVEGATDRGWRLAGDT